MKHRIFILIFLCMNVFLSVKSSIIENDSNVVILDKGWQFVRQDVGSLWEIFRPVSSPESPESEPVWTSVNLPHTFNARDAVDPDKNYYQGPGWYRKYLDIPSLNKNERILLVFDGCGQKTEVYIYDKLVGRHIGGYDSWYLDITEDIKCFFNHPEYCKRWNGKLPLAIRCDNSRDAQMMPSNLADFTLYGGLYRHVKLLLMPSVYLTDVQIKSYLSSNNKDGKVDIHLTWNTPSLIADGNLSVKIIDPKGSYIASSIDNCNHFIIHHPLLWNTDNPNLYLCRITWEKQGIKQSIIQRFGFRTYRFQEHGPFYLNGKRLLLRGTHSHEDFAGVGAAMTDEQMIEEMNQMKAMGINFIRLGHYQQSDLILRLCDKLGILVWEEIPWCRGGLGGEIYKEQGRRMLTNLITQHGNHPSIILWGLGNENDWPGEFEIFNKDSIRSYMSELNSLAHTIDPTRQTIIRRCDFCKDIPDVYSPSIWAGWYSGSYKDYTKMIENNIDKVNRFFHAEWGGDSHSHRHSEEKFMGFVGNKNGDWSETYMIHLFDWCLKEQEKMPNLTGSAFWTFRDFSTPIRPENPIPYVNQKGVVERNGTPKESYYVFQSYWTKKPMTHIYGHTWPVRWGAVGEKKEVLVFSNCEEAQLYVNGISQGVKKRNVQDYPAAGFHWNVIYQPGKNVLKVLSYKKKKIVEDEIEQEYQIGTWGDPVKICLKAQFLSDGFYLAEVKLVDKEGKICLDADSFVYFDFTGDGYLVDDLGTSDGSRKIQAANGMARIKIRTTGKGYLSVKYKNLPTEFLKLN